MSIFRAQNKHGFTLVEILVACAVIGILAGVVYASLGSARAKARDKERIAMLEQMSLALRLYKDQYGVYPDRGCIATNNNYSNWSGAGPGNQSWYVSCDDYVPGLVPQFVQKLPADPLYENQDNRGYIYRTNASRSDYKLMVTPIEKGVTNQGEPYARCPAGCSQSYCSQWVYAVYSPGAACW